MKNYKWCDGQFSKVTKYCNYSICGKVDNKTILELCDDAANVNWGGTWSMPTKEDYIEIMENCIGTCLIQNGVRGFQFKSKINGNSIFLPAAGNCSNSTYYGIGSIVNYWSRSLDIDDPNLALRLYNDLVDNKGELFSLRYIARPVRPILCVEFTHRITFDSNGGEGYMLSITIDHTEQLNIPGNKFTRHGYDFICWSTKKDGTGVNFEEGDKYAICSSMTLYAQWYKKEIEVSHKYVDLGLSVKWAICNIGASTPEEIGYFFSWGETKPKAKYTAENYKWRSKTCEAKNKYFNGSDLAEVKDGVILELSDDAANANWGDDWRMPTKEERDELFKECTWIFEEKNGVKGYTVIGINGNSIFLPTAGYRCNSEWYSVKEGYYLCSSACVFIFNMDGSDLFDDVLIEDFGYSARPVLREKQG